MFKCNKGVVGREEELEFWQDFLFLQNRAALVMNNINEAMTLLQDQATLIIRPITEVLRSEPFPPEPVSEEVLLVLKQGAEELRSIRKLLGHVPPPKGPRKKELLKLKELFWVTLKDYIDGCSYALKFWKHPTGHFGTPNYFGYGLWMQAGKSTAEHREQFDQMMSQFTEE